jgi:hypothetical protein
MISNTDGDDPRLADLLVRWQELQARGESRSADKLCSTCPELAQELDRHIALVLKMDPAPSGIKPVPQGQVSPAPAGGSNRQSATARADFRDLRFHAAGALGEVFMARNAELNRDVALKFLKPERVRDPESLRRFHQEAEVTSQLEQRSTHQPRPGHGSSPRSRRLRPPAGGAVRSGFPGRPLRRVTHAGEGIEGE